MGFVHFFDPKKHRDLVSKSHIFIIAGFLFGVLNLILIPIVGINWGIDFAGGTEMQVKFAQPVHADQIRDVLQKEGFHKNQVQSYGSPESNEWLVRVERMTIITDEKVKELDGALDAALGQDVRSEFGGATEGDRFRVFAKEPAAAGDALAEQRALDELQAKIASTVEANGLHLRRTKAGEELKETTADAIIRDEPYRGEVKFTVQLQGVSEKLTRALTAAVGQIDVRRVDFVDATVAQSLKTDGLIAMIISLALILFYVAVRFDVYFAPGAVIALMHDPVGALCVYTMGRLEFDLPSVAGLLTVVGYSISHTIVIYDRVRETMPISSSPIPYETVKQVVNQAVNDTLNRTINTTLTVLFTTVSVWIFAGGSVRAFAANLTVGCIIGAYSSILMAPGIYLYFRRTFYNPAAETVKTGPTREERERGIV